MTRVSEEPDSSPPPSEEAAAGESWRVSTRQVIGLLHEVERLREVRLRIDERRRDLEKALTTLERMAGGMQTADTRSSLTNLRRADSVPAARVA